MSKEKLVKRSRERRRVGTEVKDKSLTHQSARDEVDIKRILARGIMPPDPEQLTFADVSEGMDFRTMMDTVASVHNSFSMLPSETRSRFHNDPAKLLDFVADPENEDEAIKLGLLPKPEIPQPVEDQQVKPDKPAAPAQDGDPPSTPSP